MTGLSATTGFTATGITRTHFLKNPPGMNISGFNASEIVSDDGAYTFSLLANPDPKPGERMFFDDLVPVPGESKWFLLKSFYSAAQVQLARSTPGENGYVPDEFPSPEEIWRRGKGIFNDPDRAP